MKKSVLLVFLLLSSQLIFAQNEIGPEGHKLVWAVLVIVAVAAVFVLTARFSPQKQKKEKKPFFSIKKIQVDLEKDALYYPDNLTLKVKNTGTTDVDLTQPLLVFDNFWLKRKFKLKGMGNHTFYPLYLEKGKSHTLQIDLSRFYGHDKRLKKFPKAKVYLFDVKGKKLGSKSVFLRKTLFKF
ncbi:hypothetical protein OU798_10010 [Prolixibacteraceae bacterium Z1-6]|uniref:Uncharacterized protein n=1 Tax=Draconibacterium aestuarii TaxID=2998507 RepID=A0A9X3F566_9BACT|nr:hypothetical protein [Prolixibacteraceae bacterium Z1-6]